MRSLMPAALLAMTTLAACGSGGSDADEIPSYGHLSGSSGNVDVGGTVLAVGGSDVGTEEVAGTYNRDTNELTLQDGTVVQINPSSEYDYVTPVSASDVVFRGQEFAVDGYVGIETRNADMPTTGSAVYTGDGRAQVATSSEGYTLENGAVTLTTSFDTQSVRAELTGFDVKPDDPNNMPSDPVATIIADNMSVSGSGFRGGSISLRNAAGDDLSASVVGNVDTEEAMGTFFGYDSGLGGPDEAAGVLLLKGSDGVVAGSFVAD